MAIELPVIVVAGRGRSVAAPFLVSGRGAGAAALAVAHPVLDCDADHVYDALQGVAGDPGPERHGRVLVAAEHEHDRGDRDEGEVPEQVERHDGAGVGPVSLPLLEVLCGCLPHQHRGFPHGPPPAAAQQPRRAAEGGPAERSASATAPAAGGTAQQRRGIEGRVGTGARRAGRRHRREPRERSGGRKWSLLPENGIGRVWGLWSLFSSFLSFPHFILFINTGLEIIPLQKKYIIYVLFGTYEFY